MPNGALWIEAKSGSGGCLVDDATPDLIVVTVMIYTT